MITKLAVNRILVGAVALLLASLMMMSAFIIIRIRLLYQLQTQIVELQGEMQRQNSQHMREIEDNYARIDSLERTLFGEIVTKVAKVDKQQQKPISRSLEAWQKNQFKLLVQRLESLERWRLESQKE